MEKRKPIVAMDISAKSQGGGPHTSTMNLINSSLKEHIDYRLFEYDKQLGRFISIKRIKALASQIKEIDPDIVHFTGMTLYGFHVAAACRLAKVKKTIVVIRGSSTNAMDIGSLKKWIIKQLELMTLRLSTTYYGVSKYISEIPITKNFRKKSSGYIYNLLPISNNDGEEAFSKKDFGFAESDVVVASVARITTDKGYHILKDAIKSLDNMSNVKFLIVGDGGYLSTMKKELEEQEKAGKVRFLGFRDDIYRILPACDIFVLPTLYEALSNSLLEASAYSLPLIASNVGGIPEVITDGENGILVPVSDPTAIVDAITTLVENETMRKRMGVNAKRMLEEKFSEEVLTKQVLAVYEKLLA